jgi:hypothetical protein
MKIYDSKNNIFDAVDNVVEHGVAAIEGTKTQAIDYANKVIKCLEFYSDIDAIIGFKNVMNSGYLYYVYDLNRFELKCKKLEKNYRPN